MKNKELVSLILNNGQKNCIYSESDIISDLRDCLDFYPCQWLSKSDHFKLVGLPTTATKLIGSQVGNLGETVVLIEDMKRICLEGVG